MKTLEINGVGINEKSFKKPIYISIIISIITLFIYFLVADKQLTLSALRSVMISNRRSIVYNTFDLYLEGLGDEYSEKIKEDLNKVKYDDIKRFNFVSDKNIADIVIKFSTEGNSIFSEYLLPVGHIYWIRDSLSSSELLDGEYEILLTEELYEKYGDFLNVIYPKLEIRGVDDLLEDLEDEECGCVGLITNNQLEIGYKLLKFDNKYYLDTFDCGIEIPLVAVSQNDDINIEFVNRIIRNNFDFRDNSFDANSVAKINMTGVTAMARRVAQAMVSRNDFDYPAEKIASFLTDADLTHTSNEISFVPGCSTYSGLRFCSRPESIETLKAIGADLIELTGNHNNDFGSTYNTETIEVYKEEGMGYFGGGLNSEDAARPFIKEIDGTSIGFLGYNYYDAIVAGGTNALAGANKAGANPYSENRMKEDIEDLKERVDVVIVDFQFQECYSYPSGDVIYPICYKPINNQASTFRKAIDYGADIVVGTQAHQPQTYELYNDGVIFYGLGNLFFDQSMWIGTRQGIILTHYFIGGQLIQTKITPTMYDSSLQVEVANQEEGRLLLDLLKTARRSL